MTEQEPKSDELAAEAAELIQETNAKYEERRREQQEFLDTIAEEGKGADVLETKCNLIGDYTVPLKAKLNGDLMDRMGAIEARVERMENEEAAAYEFSEIADEASQILADSIDDSEWNKRKFYEVYREEGVEPLGEMLERVFEALKDERERREGVADGFREDAGGA